MASKKEFTCVISFIVIKSLQIRSKVVIFVQNNALMLFIVIHVITAILLIMTKPRSSFSFEL